MDWNNGGLCRCCLSRGSFKDLKSKNLWMGEEEVYYDMLLECFNIALSESNKNNQNCICEACVSTLRIAANFKKQVLHSEQEFLYMLKDEGVVKQDLKNEDLSDGGSPSEDYEVEYLDEGLMNIEKVEVSVDYESDDDQPLAKVKKRGAPKKNSSKKHRTDKLKISEPKASSIIKRHVKPYMRADIRVRAKHKHNLNLVLECSNAMPFGRSTPLGYKCLFCDSLYTDPRDLRSHTSSHDMTELKDFKNWDFRTYCMKLDINDLECTLCGAPAQTLKDLIGHLTSAHDKVYHADIGDHLIPFRLNREAVCACADCPKEFGTFKMLQQHMNEHYANYVCDDCSSTFINYAKLRIHQQALHRTGEFQCEHCDKIFGTRTKCASHVRAVHHKSVRLKCPVCSREFADYYRKKRHLIEAHNKTFVDYKCGICARAFPQPSNLMQHIKTVHMLEKKYRCEMCAKTFSRRDTLKVHLIAHSGDKNFICSVCGKAFSIRKYLRNHMRVHENERVHENDR